MGNASEDIAVDVDHDLHTPGFGKFDFFTIDEPTDRDSSFETKPTQPQYNPKRTAQ